MMARYTDIDSLPPKARGTVLVIGNFDGVHLGHQGLIADALLLAKKEQASLGVLTFEPHPRQFFQPTAEPFRLTLLPMKQRLLEGLGVDHLFAIPFDEKLSQLSADQFIDHILVKKLGVRHVAVGEDFAFGRARSGTLETLKAVQKFTVSGIKPIRSAEGQVYSSSLIRQALQQGNFLQAKKLLGRPWQIEAPVVHGDKRGRTLGFPTANQNVPEYVRIPYGIYAVRAKIEGETQWRRGVANFGIRPMFELKQPLFETMIFDFSADIYGKMMRVEPIQQLRPEMSFPTLEDLLQQMKEDCITAKAVLESSGI